MSSSVPSSDFIPLIGQETEIFNWAKSHYRNHTFAKDEKVATRPGLLYFVESWAIRIVINSVYNRFLMVCIFITDCIYDVPWRVVLSPGF